MECFASAGLRLGDGFAGNMAVAAVSVPRMNATAVLAKGRTVTAISMTDIIATIARLRVKGWTATAIATELGVDYETVRRWQTKERSPANAVGVAVVLAQLEKRRRIPKKKRYK